MRKIVGSLLMTLVLAGCAAPHRVPPPTTTTEQPPVTITRTDFPNGG